MNMNTKYNYTHFIYPYIINKKKYNSFLKVLVDKESNWNLKIHDKEANKDLYSFFLPYLRNFMFPTIYWDSFKSKKFNNLSTNSKVEQIKDLSTLTFEYNIDKIIESKTQITSKDTINFEISKINLICFSPGICFLVIKAEIQGEDVDFKSVLNFNHKFRTINPKYESKDEEDIQITTKLYENINDLSLFIKNIISDFEDEEVENIYYDRMFTYSYACVDNESWDENTDTNEIMDDFYKFQYVLSGYSNDIFNMEYERKMQKIYSRWKYSMYGFSKESGVVLASEQEIYNYTKLPYQFENTYFYVMLLAFYQRICLLKFSQELVKEDKNEVLKLKKKLIRFLNFSWFSQITNSEHGMELWNKWKEAFELEKLLDEVHKEYVEYYDEVVAKGQDRTNALLVLLYTVSVVFSGLTLVVQQFGIKEPWFNIMVLVVLVGTIMIYPAYIIAKTLRYLTAKIFRRR